MATIGTFTLKFNTDVSMAGTLRAAVAKDRAAVEQIKDDVQLIKQGIDLESADITGKHTDIVQKHGEVEADRQEVASNKTAIDSIQANINSQQSDITTRHGDIVDKHDTINTQAAQVASNAQDVANDKAHVTQTVNNFNTTAANATQAVTDEGNKQNTRVIAQGDTQEDRVIETGDTEVGSVKSEGQTQRNLIGTASGNEQTAIRNAGTQQVQRVIAEGDTRESRVTDQGDTQNQRLIAQGDTQTARASVEADRAGGHRAYVEDFAGRFGDVDAAIADATTQANRSDSEADRSTAQATIATSRANTATTQANEAKTARDEAVAIVHNDEGSIVPAASKYPVADAKGHLDIGWTPLLQAMYPYSGVIGSVDKTELIQVWPTSTSYSNRIKILSSAKYNIAGRLVSPIPYHDPNGYMVPLPEAESTADRAVAFDDIFLDWHGVVTPYRSVTPHRTSTGYDRDAIAEEHGYTKIQTGLYKTGDTYALLLGRVARRNKGAYHPVFNPEGAAQLIHVSNPSGWAPWYDVNAYKVQTGTDCFSQRKTNTGGISQSTGRPDGKFYDAIYADDFTPLYYSAKNVVDRQALLFDSFNRAVAGETFSGAESVIGPIKAIPEIFTVSRNWAFDPANANGTIDVGTTSLSDSRDIYPSGNTSFKVWLVGSTGVYLLDPNYGVEGTGGEENNQIYAPYENKACYFYSRGKSSDVTKLRELFPVGSIFQIVYEDNKQPSARPQFLMCDIIGSLDAMPDEWKANGIPGNWLSVGEEGESLIPDGTIKNFKLSRKCLECYQVLVSFDKGLVWTDQTPTWKADFEGSGNARRQAVAGPACVMVFYRTCANPFELAGRSGYTALLERAFLANTHEAHAGGLFGVNTIGKVPVSNVIDTAAIQNYYFRRSIGIEAYQRGLPKHLDFQRLNESTQAPTVKAMAYLDNDGRLVLVYKELKHNGESWGDDNKLNIVSKQSTATDLNGETVIVGQKRVELPYHFDGVLY